MKEIFKPLFILLAAISMTSCTDMLDIKPTTFVSDDLIWQDKKLIDQFVANTYGTLVCGFNRNTQGWDQDWAAAFGGNFDAGADDYLAKPFGMMELISRVNALLRRASRPSQGAAEEVAEPSDLMAVGAIKLSPSARTVVANGREVNLTRKEFDLLRTLMENKGRVLTREQLLEQVWGVSFVGETRTVDMHVKTLRRKLAEAAPGSEEAVATVRGVGYRLKKSAS